MLKWCQPFFHHSSTVLPFFSTVNSLYIYTAGYPHTWDRYSGVLCVIYHALKYSPICYSGAFCSIVYILCAHCTDLCLSLYSVYSAYRMPVIFWLSVFSALSRSQSISSVYTRLIITIYEIDLRYIGCDCYRFKWLC